MTDAELLACVRRVVAGAAITLGASRQRINDLNVYPVPDGDTGTNLVLSVGAVVDALSTVGPLPPPELAAAVRRAALMGARGNSGIILSQIVRGFCDAIGEGGAVDGPLLAAAFRAASDSAYRAVRQPVEGTILTVVRWMAEAAEQAQSDGPDAVIDAVLAAGADALARTTGMLEALRAANVVDAGGAGLLEIARGAAAAYRGQVLDAVPDAATAPPSIAEIHAEPSRFRYCTSFLVSGAAVDPATLERQLAALGDCLIVVGDAEATKVHLHTDDPGRAISLATAMGALAGVDVADMHGQIESRNDRLARPDLRIVAPERRATDVVFVVAGDGNRRIAESMGARLMVAGGQSMNPSTADLVGAIEASAAEGVIVLPNNRNVVLTAHAAAEAAAMPTVVVPTTSIAAGLAVLVAYDPELSLADASAAMSDALGGVRTAEITRAVRDAQVDGIEVAEGAWLALVDGHVVASALTIEGAVRAAAGELLGGQPGVVTALTGSAPDEADAARAAVERIAGEHPDIEFEIQDGGQPVYALVLGAE